MTIYKVNIDSMCVCVLCVCDLLCAHEETVFTSLALSLVELLPTSRQSPCSHHFAMSRLAAPLQLAYICLCFHAFTSHVFPAFALKS